MSSSRRYTLEDFKLASPDDLSPVAFLDWVEGSVENKSKLHLAYIALFSQAKRSPIAETRAIGVEMERMWKSAGGRTLDTYWHRKSSVLRKLRKHH
ncbi:hypothetical protein BGZ65_009907 [Modicella reniformis]|uniref:Uncharacterized protein n=1 Tax=Modicella reniformis TaxID=1440133 RepID=A0A9P6ME67_9FUNG|nr:hypothetical protein BGZ65_009907 [Modicella reniformis]